MIPSTQLLQLTCSPVQFAKRATSAKEEPVCHALRWVLAASTAVATVWTVSIAMRPRISFSLQPIPQATALFWACTISVFFALCSSVSSATHLRTAPSATQLTTTSSTSLLSFASLAHYRAVWSALLSLTAFLAISTALTTSPTLQTLTALSAILILTHSSTWAARTASFALWKAVPNAAVCLNAKPAFQGCSSSTRLLSSASHANWRVVLSAALSQNVDSAMLVGSTLSTTATASAWSAYLAFAEKVAWLTAQQCQQWCIQKKSAVLTRVLKNWLWQWQ